MISDVVNEIECKIYKEIDLLYELYHFKGIKWYGYCNCCSYTLLIHQGIHMRYYNTITFLESIPPFLIAILCLFAPNLAAQDGSFDVRFKVKSFDCPNNKVVIQVQVKTPDFDHAFLMGDANFRFDYDPRIINNPQIVTQDNFSNQEPALDDNYGTQNLNGSSVNATLGTVSLNVVYSGSNSDAYLVYDEWSDVAGLSFDIINPSACLALLWHNDVNFPVTGMNEIILKPGGEYDQFPVPSNGVFDNLNICLPQLCNSIVAVDDINTTLKNAAVSGSMATNDNSTNGSKIYSILSPFTNGVVNFTASGNYTYTPNPDFLGFDAVTYRVCNTLGQCDIARLVVSITDLPLAGVNNIPVALNDVAVTYQDEPIVGNVLNNDFDADGDFLAVSETIVKEASNGILYLDADGAFAYIPNPGFVGRDTAIYSVCDAGNPVACTQAMMVFIVTEDKNGSATNPPFANDDAFVTYMETPVPGYLTLNDFKDLNNDVIPTQITPVVAPAHGQVTIGEDGSFTYTPAAGFHGADQFSYVICYNRTPNLCDTATVYLMVYPEPNLAPLVTEIHQTTVQLEPLSFCLDIIDPNMRDTHTATVCGVQQGRAVVSVDNDSHRVCGTYTSNADFLGKDTVCIIVCDNGIPSKCDTVRIVFTIRASNLAPLAVNDINVTLSGAVTTGNVLINDSDPNHQMLTVEPTPIILPTHGNIIFNATGGYAYTPDSNFEGTETIAYQVCDNGSPSLCDTALLVIEVRSLANAGDQKPVTNDDNLTIYNDAAVTVHISANDFEPSYGTLNTATLIGSPIGGTAVVNSDGTITFTTTSGFVGEASVLYQICNSNIPSLCDTARVTFQVLAALPVGNNKAPIAIDDVAKTYRNTAVQITVATNDIGQGLSYALIYTTVRGALTMNPNGTFIYTPENEYIGSDNFTYQVCDNSTPNKCDTAVGHIVVLNLPCITLDIKVLLEGAYQFSTGKMKTTLNRRGLLPGQTPVGSFAIATPAGQPFNQSPWNYAGTESVTNYAPTVVDWVLVSVRTDTVSANSTIFKTAGLLHEDGRVELLDACFSVANNRPLYVMVEHRNHLGVMSPAAIPLSNHKLTVDFTTANSFTLNNPPSFGQKLMGGKWFMFAGDGSKSSRLTNFDINFTDSQLWKSENGIFDRYRNSDFNLDADLNFQDQILWKNNNGKYSGIPH